MSAVAITPDGEQYLAMGRGVAVSRPYCLRPFLPLILRDSVLAWRVCSILSTVLLCFLVGVYAHRFGFHWAYGALFMAALPTVFFWLRAPVLVDAPAMVFAVGSALLPWPWCLISVVFGAGIRETVPVFAALYAWDWRLLAGLVVPALFFALIRPGSVQAQDSRVEELMTFVTRHPILASLRHHKGRWRDIGSMVLPWGGLLAVLCYPTVPLLVTLAVAYGTLLVATDTARLYVWAAPVVIAHMVAVPVVFVLPLLVFTWFNPWRGNGV